MERLLEGYSFLFDRVAFRLTENGCLECAVQSSWCIDNPRSRTGAESFNSDYERILPHIRQVVRCMSSEWSDLPPGVVPPSKLKPKPCGVQPTGVNFQPAPWAERSSVPEDDSPGRCEAVRMADNNVRLKPRCSAEYVRLFHPDPVRPARMFPPQNFRQFGVECTLCSLGHSCRFSAIPR